MIVHQSSSPLKKLQHLQRKVKIEQSFHIKSKRALLQIRIQSGILSLFYFGLQHGRLSLTGTDIFILF